MKHCGFKAGRGAFKERGGHLIIQIIRIHLDEMRGLDAFGGFRDLGFRVAMGICF